MFDDVENQLQNSTASHSVANSAIASDSAHTFEDAPIRSAIPAGQKVEAPPDEVAWEDDPENARNWPSKKKWIAVSIVRSSVSAVSLILILSSGFPLHIHPSTV